MTKTALLTFQDDTEIKLFTEFCLGHDVSDAFRDRLKHVIDHIQYNPSIKDDNMRECKLVVSGQTICVGNYTDLSKRFAQEVDSHSGSVSLHEKRGDEWTIIRRRRTQ